MRMHFLNRTGTRLLFILALAAILRLWGLGVKQLWLDELLQLIHSQPDTLRGILEGVAKDRGGAPLDYLIQHLFITNLNGAIEWTARLHAALFGVLTVYLIYVVCRTLFNNARWSLLSALLFSVYPFHHHYSQEGRPYSLFLLLTLTLFLLLLQSLKKNRWYIWVCFAVVSLMSFYTHAYTAFVLFTQLLILGYHQILRRERLSDFLCRLAGFLLCSLIAAAAYIPWLRYSYSNAKGSSPPGSVFRLLMEMIKGFGDGSYPLALALILCAGAGVYFLRKANYSFELGALLIWIVLPFPLVLIILNLRNYFFAARQLIFIAPALIILAAIGADYLRERYRLRHISPAAILILISIVVIGLHYPDRRDDLRAASQFLRTNVQRADVIIAPGLTYTLSFYFPEINDYAADARSIEDLKAAPNVSRILYVDSRFNYSRYGLDALNAGLPKPDEARFRGVTLYTFRLK